MNSVPEVNKKTSKRSRAMSKVVRSTQEPLSAQALVMQAELVSLREENARLRMAKNNQPGMQQTIDRLRSATSDHIVVGPGSHLAEEADHLWHVLAEAVVIREGLLSACRDLAAAAISLEERLEGLIPKFSAAEKLGEELEDLIDLTDDSDEIFTQTSGDETQNRRSINLNPATTQG